MEGNGGVDVKRSEGGPRIVERKRGGPVRTFRVDSVSFRLDSVKDTVATSTVCGTSGGARYDTKTAMYRNENRDSQQSKGLCLRLGSSQDLIYSFHGQ